MTEHISEFDPETAIRRFSKSKVRPPKISIQPIDRERLLDKLNAALVTPITYLIAPAGFGKSILLSQWRDLVTQQGETCAWVNLDDNDQEIKQFFASLVLALDNEGVNLDSLPNMAELGFINMSSQGIGEEILIAIENLDKPVIIILDDFHKVEAPIIGDFIQALCKSCADKIRLIIASRNWVGSHHVEQVLSGNAMDVPSSDLLFTDEEVRKTLGTDFDEQTRTDLLNQAEGWPVAVQMMRMIGLHGQSLRVSLDRLQRDNGDMAEYLTKQILGDLDDELQDYLLKTAILNRFNNQLANAICDRQDSEALLHKLVGLNALIIPMDDNFEWHRYHHLFSQYLRRIYKQKNPTEFKEVHHRAAEWCEENGYVSEAIEYSNAIEDYQGSTDIISRNGSWRLAESVGEGYLNSLFLKIPEQVVQGNARLLYTKAYIYSCAGDLKRALAYRDAAEALIEKNGATPENIEDRLSIGTSILCRMELNTDVGIPMMEMGLAMAQPDDLLSTGVLHSVLTGMHSDRAQFEKSIEHAEMAIADLERAPTPFPLNHGHLQYGLNGFYSGDTARARTHFELALQIVSSTLASKSNMRHMADMCLQSLNYWQGSLTDKGYSLLRSSLFKTLDSDGWFDTYAMGFNVLFHHAVMAHDFRDALAILVKLETANYRFGVERIEKFCSILRLELHLYEGQLGAAEIEYNKIVQWHSLEEDEAEVYFWFLRIKGAYVRAKYLSAIGKVEDALVLVDEAIVKAKSLEVTPTIIEGYVLQAILFQKAEESEQAASALMTAANLATPRHWTMIFSGQEISSKIWNIAIAQGRREQFGPSTIEFMETVSAVDRNVLLTERELEVLNEFSKGSTNKETARTLNLTENTIKFHAKKIYAKLNVTKRVQAVAAGRKLDLLP